MCISLMIKYIKEEKFSSKLLRKRNKRPKRKPNNPERYRRPKNMKIKSKGGGKSEEKFREERVGKQKLAQVRLEPKWQQMMGGYNPHYN